MALLDVAGIDAYYGRIRALSGVSLRVDAGEIVTLIGANGAGKTTTLRMMSGLIRPDSGEIRVCGIDAVAEPPDLLRYDRGEQAERDQSDDHHAERRPSAAGWGRGGRWRCRVTAARIGEMARVTGCFLRRAISRLRQIERCGWRAHTINVQ